MLKDAEKAFENKDEPKKEEKKDTEEVKKDEPKAEEKKDEAKVDVIEIVEEKKADSRNLIHFLKNTIKYDTPDLRDVVITRVQK